MPRRVLDEDDAGCSMNRAAISASGLHKVFRPRRDETVTALRDVGFTAEWGRLTGIVGPSGSGKSTLMYCLAGLEPVTSGSVRLLGQEITTMGRARSARFRRDHLGFVFQSYNLVPSMTVAGNLRLPFTLRRRPFPARSGDAVLQRLGIARLTGAGVAQLSGGEQQRVALARVLISDPEIVFADEPTGALDSESSERVVEQLRRVAARGDRAVVMVTHSAEVAAACDRVVQVRDGRVVEPAPAGSAA